MQAIIIAGGKGTRLKPITNKIPKLLIPLLNKPLIDHLVNHLKINNCNSIIICTGHMGNKITKYIKENYYDIDIKISHEKKPLGTAGALGKIKELLEENFFILFGDVYTTVDLNKMFNFHKKHKAVVTAAIHKSSHPKDSNLVEFNSNFKITKILKKPHKKISKDPYNLAALYIVSNEIKKYLSSKNKHDFEHDILVKLLDQNVPIYGYDTSEIIIDIGTPSRLKKAEDLLKK
jgi:NDP-sugar pyrophosphorylase family protein